MKVVPNPKQFDYYDNDAVVVCWRNGELQWVQWVSTIERARKDVEFNTNPERPDLIYAAMTYSEIKKHPLLNLYF